MGQENHPHHNTPVKIYPYFETPQKKITYFFIIITKIVPDIHC